MVSQYKTTIGLEIHAELKTRTKMFCSCLNDFLETRPNVNVCPVCLGHPGVMPTINRKAIEEVIKLGLALGGEILNHSRFDRKSYFYPDLPKGYQISQYELPLVKGGELSGVQVRRIHLEEDTARLLHEGNHSLVDFNRAGVPLIELVTEPVIDSALKALEFGKEVQLILRYLDISDADMEKGQMRVEANVSVAPAGHEELGTKVELKNINSFRAVKNALVHEIERQKELLEKGEKVIQETRGWNEVKGITVSQRGKEEAHDYRYLPEPDLPPMELTTPEVINLEELRRSLPELPEAKRERFKQEFNLPEKQTDVLIGDRYLAEYFEEAVSEFLALEENGKSKGIQLVANYLTSDLVGLLKESGARIQDTKATPENFAELVVLILKGDVSSRIAKVILREMAATGMDPNEIIGEKGLTQISDESEITNTVEKIINENRDAVESYKEGKTNSLQFLVGQVMAEAKGRANPQIVQEILKKIIEK
ncbi:MAG: Asp-tRNA(Asn)/Glu-tRNA(Gln) amidotransferase subunit GatB [Candidatus Colwellbacteria bacterium]|nr:Asp-tRNA(Asn)/Glu-tRNA(Gln) amidotransferase subunit GatB [Candidatus Colwellbacteria bacterium]